jgi:hypothetical protein
MVTGTRPPEPNSRSSGKDLLEAPHIRDERHCHSSLVPPGPRARPAGDVAGRARGGRRRTPRTAAGRGSLATLAARPPAPGTPARRSAENGSPPPAARIPVLGPPGPYARHGPPSASRLAAQLGPRSGPGGRKAGRNGGRAYRAGALAWTEPPIPEDVVRLHAPVLVTRAHHRHSQRRRRHDGGRTVHRCRPEAPTQPQTSARARWRRPEVDNAEVKMINRLGTRCGLLLRARSSQAAHCSRFGRAVGQRRAFLGRTQPRPALPTRIAYRFDALRRRPE